MRWFANIVSHEVWVWTIFVRFKTLPAPRHKIHDLSAAFPPLTVSLQASSKIQPDLQKWKPELTGPATARVGSGPSGKGGRKSPVGSADSSGLEAKVSSWPGSSQSSTCAGPGSSVSEVPGVWIRTSNGQLLWMGSKETSAITLMKLGQGQIHTPAGIQQKAVVWADFIKIITACNVPILMNEYV